jgi:glutamine---fructose-6-phosphate transaminase (isomerizing)
VAATRLEQELRDQGAALARREQVGWEGAARAAALLQRADIQYVVIAARGSSDNAARYAQYLFGADARLSVALATPALYGSAAPAPRLDGTAVIGISQSGQSPDIVGVLVAARAQGRPTIAITNDDASPLAAAADVVVPLAVEPERSVAATKTYLGSLHALLQIVEHVSPDSERRRWLGDLPAIIDDVVDAQLHTRARFDAIHDAQRLTVVGRRLGYATAYEVALKVRELGGLATEAFSPPDLLHGPVAALDSTGWSWLVAPGRAGAVAEYRSVLTTLADRTAGVVVAAQDSSLLDSAAIGITIPADMPDWLASLVAVIPGQVAGLRLAEIRGVDVDRPHGLSKVTLTR